LYEMWARTRTPADSRRLGQRYEADLAVELAAFERYLPDTPPTVMDIGCGLGGIDVLISRHYGHEASFVLIDRDEFAPHPYYGFRQIGAAYNSLDETRSFLRSNGVVAESLTTVNVAVEPFPQDARVDVVLSLLSWGYHYPIEAYLDDVCRVLCPGGMLIVDIRKGTDGVAVLSERFELETVAEDPKSQRVFGRIMEPPTSC
jgi:SAM-dependent methyltransferase